MAKLSDSQSPRSPADEPWQPPIARNGRGAPSPSPMTYEEFLDWADEDTLAEWVNGEIVMASPANLDHQNIAGFLYEVMKAFARMRQLGVIIQPPFQMRLTGSGREPDVIFVAEAHRDRIKRIYVDGPADLAVEVVSPESAERDRQEKFAEYQEGSVSEYWLIDPDTRRAEFYQLGEDGRYRPIATDADGAYHSRALPGFWLRVSWLWQDPLPGPARALFAIDREGYTRYLEHEARQADEGGAAR